MTTRIARRACVKCNKNRPLDSFVGDRGRTCAVCRKATARTSARRGHLAKTYGITQDEYDAILAEQDGRCAVCYGKRSYHLQVDHDHKLEAAFATQGHYDRVSATRASIRGLVCRRCNKLLRDVRDDRVLLDRASAYLAHPPAREILWIETQLAEASAE